MSTPFGLRLGRRAAGVPLALVAVVVIAAFVGTACGPVTAEAATVDGHIISQAGLDRELRAILANASYVAAIEQTQPVKGKGVNGTFDLAFADKVLTRQILLQVVHDEVVRRHLVITGDDIKKAANNQRTQIGADQRGRPMFDAFSVNYQNLLARRGAEVTALQNALGNVRTDDAAVRQYYDANAAKFKVTCAAHILVKDKATADSVRAQLVAGGSGNDFATLAKKDSTDTQSAANGGDLGCQPPGTFVAQFEQVEQALGVGQLSQPTQTQFGWHLIKVTDRKTQSLADAKSQIVQQLQTQAQSKLSDFIQRAISTAKITVNRRYGTFAKSGANTGVVPPTPPSSAVGGVSGSGGQSGQQTPQTSPQGSSSSP